MNAQQPTHWFHGDWFYIPVVLLTLVSFVVSGSIYEALASNRQFLAVRQVGKLQLVEIVFVFNILPAVVLFSLWSFCRLLHRKLAQTFLAVVYCVFFLAFFLQVHNTYLKSWRSFPAAYVLWVIPAVLAGFASLRFANQFRSFLLALSPAIVLFPALFLYRTWTPAKQAVPARQIPSAQPATSAQKKLPPIFLLIFDEFRFRDLLKENGEIDGALFPNFQKLSNEAFWFRNATANGDATALSLPVILTGNYPRGIDPSYQVYSNNLLTLLQPWYDIYVHETVTHFCIPGRYNCPDAEGTSSDRELLEDVLVIYAARVMPKSFDVGLPEVESSWGSFKDAQEQIQARVNRFQSFLNSLSSIRSDRPLVLFHQMLPHSPYLLTSKGTTYQAEILNVDPDLAGKKDLLQSLHQRYLMQVGYVDEEVGQFLDRLKQLGLYDKSLIVITADHGISFLPDAPGRLLTPANAEEILPVPLFIKTPFQKQGEVSDRDVQDIDILATLGGLLGVEIPWAHVGRNIFAANPARRMKTAYSEVAPAIRFAFPDTLGATQATLLAAAERSPFIGQKIETFEVLKDLSVFGTMDHVPFSLLQQGQKDEEIPVNVFGWAVRPDSPGPPEIVVAVDGEIVAVTSPCCERPDVVASFNRHEWLRSGWQTAFSSRKLRAEINPVTAYVVLDEKQRKLALLDASGTDIIHRVQVTHAGAQRASALIGNKVESFVIGSYEGIKGFVDSIGVSSVRIQTGRDSFPIYVRGWAARLSTSTIPEEVVVALNDEIVAVASPSLKRTDVADTFNNQNLLMSGWMTSFPSKMLRAGKNQIAAYVVLDAKTRRLMPLGAKEKVISVTFE